MRRSGNVGASDRNAQRPVGLDVDGGEPVTACEEILDLGRLTVGRHDVEGVGHHDHRWPPADDPVAALGDLTDGDVVLVKASRVGGLERVAEALLTA